MTPPPKSFDLEKEYVKSKGHHFEFEAKKNVYKIVIWKKPLGSQSLWNIWKDLSEDDES